MALSAEVDTWGFTFVASRKGDEPWKQFQAVDLVRGGSRGKPFWHAEAQAGPLWMQPQVIGRPREDGRIADENDVRLWNLVSCAPAEPLAFCTRGGGPCSMGRCSVRSAHSAWMAR